MTTLAFAVPVPHEPDVYLAVGVAEMAHILSLAPLPTRDAELARIDAQLRATVPTEADSILAALRGMPQ